MPNATALTSNVAIPAPTIAIRWSNMLAQPSFTKDRDQAANWLRSNPMTRPHRSPTPIVSATRTSAASRKTPMKANASSR